MAAISQQGGDGGLTARGGHSVNGIVTAAVGAAAAARALVSTGTLAAPAPPQPLLDQAEARLLEAAIFASSERQVARTGVRLRARGAPAPPPHGRQAAVGLFQMAVLAQLRHC